MHEDILVRALVGVVGVAAAAERTALTGCAVLAGRACRLMKQLAPGHHLAQSQVLLECDAIVGEVASRAP